MRKKPIAYLPPLRGDEWDPFVHQLTQLIDYGTRNGRFKVEWPISYTSASSERRCLIIVTWAGGQWTISIGLPVGDFKNREGQRFDNIFTEHWRTSYPDPDNVYFWTTEPMTFSASAAARYLAQPLSWLGVEPRENWHPELARFPDQM